MASCRMPCPGHPLLLLLLLLVHHYYPAQGTIHVKSEEWWEGRPRPYFAHSPTNVTVISGQTSFLPCRVHMLGDRSVMWMRGRDLHILTVGKVTYSADERFQIMHSHETDDWTLQIQYTQPRDAGAYKCQVNSDPKIVRNVYLTVTDKRYLDGQLYKMPPSTREQGEYGTHIVGGGTRFLQAGSSLALECVVTHTRAPPSAVLWYRDNNLLDYDSPRGGISLQVEKAGQQTTSRLLLSSVRETDSGNYTCVPVSVPVSAPTASVTVHVSTGNEAEETLVLVIGTKGFFAKNDAQRISNTAYPSTCYKSHMSTTIQRTTHGPIPPQCDPHYTANDKPLGYCIILKPLRHLPPCIFTV